MANWLTVLGVLALASVGVGCSTPPKWVHGKSGISPTTALADYRQCRDLSETKREPAEAAVILQLSTGATVQSNMRSIAGTEGSKVVDGAFDACLKSRGYAVRELSREEYSLLYTGLPDLMVRAYIMAGVPPDKYRLRGPRQRVDY